MSILGSLPFTSKGGHSLGRALMPSWHGRPAVNSGAPTHGVTWSCHAAVQGSGRHVGPEDWLAPVVVRAMCFPLAAHNPGRGWPQGSPSRVLALCQHRPSAVVGGEGHGRGALEGAVGGVNVEMLGSSWREKGEL